MAIALTGPGGTAAADEGDMLLTEDFEDGVANGWAPQGGTWAVVDVGGDSVYRATYNDGGATTLTATAGSSTWSDYAVEAVLTSANDANAIALRGRYRDANNTYALSLNTSTNTLSLSARVNGTSTTLDTAAATLDTGVAYRVGLRMDGDAITGYLNGTEVLAATDASLVAGRVMVGGYSKSNFSVDDVIVTDLRPTPAGDRYITPTGAGTRDGSSWANAFQGDRAGGLQRAWEATGPASTLHVGSGTYTTPQTLIMSSGGQSVTALKTLTGVNTGGGLPTFVGDFSLANQVQRQLIEVPVGVSHWRVRDLAVENYFYGIMARGQHVGVRIDNFDVTNSSDAIYLWGLPSGSSGDPATASHDIVITGGDYLNFTKSAVRFRNGNYLASVIDTRADAGGQANWLPGNFPLGFRVGDSGQASNVIEHDIVFQDVVSRNGYHEAGTSYWNGDGFTAERRARNITYVRARAFDSTDGGFDDKSTNPAYIDTVAFGNKRNYRIWSSGGAQFFGAIGAYSIDRGGSGDSVGLWAGAGTAVVDAYYSTFTNNAHAEIRLEDAVRVDIHDSIMAKTNGTALYTITGTGPLTVHDSEEYIAGVQGTDPQFVAPQAGWEGGTNAFDSRVYGTTKGYHSSGEHDTPYTVDSGTSSLALGVYDDASVTVTVVDAGGQPVADPQLVVWYSEAGDVARLLSARGATAQVQGLTAGATEIVAVYKGEKLRIPVTVTG
ncbi:hypothetical protein [Jiangella alkaliphila]|uniref:hypothetical protein n=1 Tax=Jiangella alkaliphila TaxID=419479 RepID=UPI00062921DD|nr:hypothetical protein [Jiangella alkaliphila]